MLPGPIFRREMKVVSGRRERLALRMGLAIVLGVVLVVSALASFAWSSLTTGNYHISEVRRFGVVALIALAVAEVILLISFVPNMVAGAIADEKERNTLELLILTRLTRAEIVLTKLSARLVPSASMVVVGFPFQLSAAWMAGIPPALALLVVAAEFTTVLVMGSLSMLASAQHEKGATARAMGAVYVVFWLVGVPIVAVMPAGRGYYGAELVSLIKGGCHALAPSSPMSLVTSLAWITSPRPLDELGARLTLMIEMQAGLAVVATFAAAASLRVREPHPFQWDPFRGYRPPVSDDPIFWREFELPQRYGSTPKLLAWTRQLVNLVRLLLLTLLQIFLFALLVLLPIGLIVQAFRLGIPAFVELWRNGYSASGPFTARDAFNQLLRGVSGFFVFLPLVVLSSGASGSITIERDKGTWLALLTTPLEGRQIILSKMRALARAASSIAAMLGIFWLMGVAAGSIHPLGALLAALDFSLAYGAALVLGMWLGLRPGTTASASSRAAFGALALIGLHLVEIVALLSSNHDLAWFLRQDLRLRTVVIVILVAIPLATGAFAWRTYHVIFRRFDEWVGRPIRNTSPPEPSAGVPAPLDGTPALQEASVVDASPK